MGIKRELVILNMSLSEEDSGSPTVGDSLKKAYNYQNALGDPELRSYVAFQDDDIFNPN